MNCETFRSLYTTYTTFPLEKEVWDTPEGDAWNDHLLRCQECSDYHMSQQAAFRGADVQDYPCVHLAYYASWTCDEHPDPDQCHNSVIRRIDKFDEYVISPRGGGGDGVTISHCPWCGVNLPVSRRDNWFDELRALGIDPWEDVVPERYETDAWFRHAPAKPKP